MPVGSALDKLSASQRVDVRMPDGTVMRNVPRNAKKADIERAWKKARAAGAVKDKRDTSFVQGVTEGVMPVAANALRTLGNVLPMAKAGPYNLGQMGADYLQGQFNNEMANAPTRGSTAGRITGEIAATLPTSVLKGAATAGALSGGLLAKDISDPRELLTSAAIGGLFGKVGEQVGKRVVAPVAERVGRTKPVRAVAEAASKAIGRNALPNPSVSKPDRAVMRVQPDLAGVRQNVADAQRLGLPYALADASPELRALAGSVSRKSGSANALAEKTFTPRAAGQADRALNAIDDLLAPATDIGRRQGVLSKLGNRAAGPHYREAFQQSAPIDDDLAKMLATPAGKEALKRARTIAVNAGRNPDELGFVINEGGEVSLKGMMDSQKGRYQDVALGNPEEALSKFKVRTWRGDTITKRGPFDLVGWLRANGGLKDQNGELSHMGIGNAARKMDMVGKEAQFGPLVHDGGRNFDDAAVAAWEAGYFPELNTRPTVNQFLDALRDTHEGVNRRFVPDDMPEVERFFQMQDELFAGRQARFETGRKAVQDMSQAAGPRDFVPREVQEVRSPTFETLDMVKRGLDDILSAERNPISGELNLKGKPLAQSVESLRKKLVGKLDALDASGSYPKARSEYQAFAQRGEALDRGLKNSAPGVKLRDMERATKRLGDTTLPEFQRGYATGMADKVEGVRLSGNPYNAIYGAPRQQNKIASLFPEGSQDFARLADLEGDMSKTAWETLGGSPTQRRAMADQLFDRNVGNMGEIALQAATNPKAALGRLGIQKLKDTAATRGEVNAAAIAPRLFDTNNPQGILAYLDDLTRKAREEQIRKEAYQRSFGILGIPVGAGAVIGAQ